MVFLYYLPLSLISRTRDKFDRVASLITGTIIIYAPHLNAPDLLATCGCDTQSVYCDIQTTSVSTVFGEIVCERESSTSCTSSTRRGVSGYCSSPPGRHHSTHRDVELAGGAGGQNITRLRQEQPQPVVSRCGDEQQQHDDGDDHHLRQHEGFALQPEHSPVPEARSQQQPRKVSTRCAVYELSMVLCIYIYTRNSCMDDSIMVHA